MNSRFLNADGTDESKNIRDIAGYKKLRSIKAENPETGILEDNLAIAEFWILPDVFKREILQGRNDKLFNKQLIERGYILPDKKSNKTTQTKRAAKEQPKRYVVVLAAKIID